MFTFIKTTIAGGLLLILLRVLVFVLIEKAIHLLSVPVQKVVPLFSGFSVAGVNVPRIHWLQLLSTCLACRACHWTGQD